MGAVGLLAKSIVNTPLVIDQPNVDATRLVSGQNRHTPDIRTHTLDYTHICHPWLVSL